MTAWYITVTAGLYAADAVGHLRYLAIEVRELAVDIINQAVALLDFFVEGCELAVGELGVFLGLGEVGVEALDFSLELGFFLLELFF